MSTRVPVQTKQQQEGNRALHGMWSSQARHESAGMNGDSMSFQHAAGNNSVNYLVKFLSRGEPLPTEFRGEMEQRFGEDFRNVRVHTGTHAIQATNELSAKAFTFGNNIAFNQGRFAPGVTEGKRLLAHELAHVVQQSRGGTLPALNAHAAHENAADAAATQIVTGSDPVTVGGATGVGVARELDKTSAPPTSLQCKPDPYEGMSIKQLRARATDKLAAEELWKRFSDMSNIDLERYARNDPMAQSIYAQRTIPPKELVGQGRFSLPEVESFLREDLINARAQSPQRRTASPAESGLKTEGGTIGAARTDIPGFENRHFIGKSPQAGGQVNLDSQFTPATDPKVLPQTHGHAEQAIADQLNDALKSVPREMLKGRRVWMLIEQEPCSTCAQGVLNPDTARGVLRKLADAYPELTFEIKNLNTSGCIVMEARTTLASASSVVPVVSSPKLVLGSVPFSSAPKILPTEPPVMTQKIPLKVAERTIPPMPTEVGKGTVLKLPAYEVPGVGRGAVRGGIGGELAQGKGRAGAVAGGFSVLGMLVVELIIQMVILPKLLELLHELEAMKIQSIQEKIQKDFDNYLSHKIMRQIRYNYFNELKEYETIGKTTYVKVTLMIRLEDTSNRTQFFTETPPETIFDFDYYNSKVASVSLTNIPVEASTGTLMRSESGGFLGRDKSFINNNPLWEQSITFSFLSPTSEAIMNEYLE